MPTDGIWRAVALVANVIGIIVALAALGLVATSRVSASS